LFLPEFFFTFLISCDMIVSNETVAFETVLFATKGEDAMAHILGDLTYISRCGAQYRNEKLEPLGLTGRQGSTLFVVCHNPGISQEQLGKKVVLNKSNITRQLTFLEDNGYVVRSVSPTDKRVLQVFPTEKALEVLPEIRQVYRDWRELLLQDMTEQEQQQMESLLARIKERAGIWLNGGASD